MKETFSDNGARDRPAPPDEEKLRLSKERRTTNRARAKAGIEDTAFRQAEKASTFASREEAFPSGTESENPSVSAARQRVRIRRGYAKDVRIDLGTDETVDPAGKNGKITGGRHAGESFHTEKGAASKGQFYSENDLPKSSAFYVGDDPGTARKIGRNRTAGRRFRRTADAGSESLRSVVDQGVLQGEENDPAASGAARTGYGAARLGAEGTEKTVKKVRTAVERGHFSTEKVSGPARTAAINPKASAFYGGPEGKAAAEAARQKTEKALQRRLIRKNYQTAPGSVVYIPIVSRIREKARAKSGQAAAAGGKTLAKKVAEFFEQHPLLLVVILLSGILITVVSSAISGGAILMSHTVTPATLATTYTAEDSDIKGAENDYRAMEADLNSKIDDIATNYPGYSSYELNAGQVGHDPYKLAALLTVLHEDYKREDVQDDLKRIFETQYNLSMSDEAGTVERKTVRVGQSLGNVVTSRSNNK